MKEKPMLPWIVVVPEGIVADEVTQRALSALLPGASGVLIVPAEVTKHLRVHPDHREPPIKAPCKDGFKWIGQSARTCDECGFPSWEHTGMAVNPPGAGPFFFGDWLVRPWAEGEAEAMRKRWSTDEEDK